MSRGNRARRQIISDSTMWQSPRWNRVVDTVYVRSPRHRLVNHPLLVAVRLIVKRSRYSVVVTTGNKTALLYGLMCRLLLLRQKQVVTQLYLDEHQRFGWLLDGLMRLALRGVYGVLVPSSGEIPLVAARFGVPTERIRFVAYHTTVEEPENLGACDGYIFAAGRNFRDYETLLDAIDGTDVQTVIVCGENQLRDREVPSNVTIHREIPWEDYVQLLKRTSVAVIPLNTENVPSGQVAILEATAYGKPVITTRSVGTIDYIEDGVNGLLYTAGNAEDLRAKILKLTSDSGFRTHLADAAYRSTVEKFTFDVHVTAKLDAIRSLVSTEPSAIRSPSASDNT